MFDSCNNDRKTLRGPIVALLSFVIAGTFLYLVLRSLDWRSFWSILKSGNYKIIAFLIPLSSFNCLLRALRWRILVQSEGKVSALSVFWANMVGYMGNSYLPARAGELLRSACLGKLSGAGTSFVLATALTERILDALALVLIGSTALVFQIKMSAPIIIAVRTMTLASLVSLLIILIIPFYEYPLTRFLNTVPFPAAFRDKSIHQFQRLLLGMRSLHSIRRLSLFALFTAAIWLIDGLGTMVGVRIIGQSLSLGQALILLSALGLSSAIPSTPGYIGIYQFVAITVLIPFGFTRPDALAYILISQMLSYFIITLWGLIGLTQIKTAGAAKVLTE